MTFEEAAKKCKKKKHVCMRVVTCRRSITAFPSHMSESGFLDVKRAVQDVFGPTLFHYNEAFRGVPVAFGNVKCLDASARVVGDWPRLVLRVQMEIVLFAPRLKDKLDGVVVKVSPCQQRLSLLACNLFNVSVYSRHGKKGVDGVKVEEEEEPKVGDKVRVEVVGIASFRSTIHIKGNLIKILKTAS